MNRIERLTAIVLLLQEKSHTSAAIARHFEVSKRTILRDVQALSEMGIPVIAREGVGGGYALPDDYYLAPLPLSLQESFLLHLALRSLIGLAALPFEPARASLLIKLRSILPKAQLAGLEPMLERVEVDIPHRLQPAPFLDDLMAAMQAQRWLEVTYQSAERRSTQQLLPQQLSTQNGFWYCRAYSHTHQTERIYRVDRIRTLAWLANPLPTPTHPPSVPYTHESHPQIVAFLTAQGVAYVESEPQLGQSIQHHADGTGSLNFRCPPTELKWYTRYFASLGDDVLVQEPQELRQQIYQLGQKLTNLYQQR